MAKPSNFGRWRRLEVNLDMSPMSSTASIALITVRNLDAGSSAGEGVIAGGPIGTLNDDTGTMGLEDVFRNLGFDVSFSYSPPNA